MTSQKRPPPGRIAGVDEVPVVEIPRLVGVHHEAVMVPLLELGREADRAQEHDDVRDLIERGDLPHVELPGVRRVLIDQRDLDRLVETGRRASS